MSRRARIAGVGHWLPPLGVDGAEVERRVNHASAPFRLPPGIVELVSGVAHRYHAPPPLSSADLAARATTAALERAGCAPDRVDLLVFASASTALLEPATANIVQELTGCVRARVFDVKNACNSFVDGIDVAQAFVASGRYERVVVAAGEVSSPVIGWRIRDREEMARRLAGLTLGDAGAACVLEPATTPDTGLLPGHFTSDGSRWRLSVVMSGGTILRDDVSRLVLDCDSTALAAAGREAVPKAILATLDAVGWAPDTLDLVVPHQVSDAAIDGICALAGIDPARCARTLRRHGNTAAASIPLALSLADQDGELAPGSRVLLVGASAGFSVGVIPLVWG